MQLIIFANAVTMEVKNIDMLVLDNSRSYYSRELINHFKNSPWFNSVEVIDNPQQLKDGIDTQQASIALEIPPDFVTAIKNKTGASLQLITDGRQTNSAAIIGNYATQIIQNYTHDLTGNTAGVENRHQKLVQCQSGLQILFTCFADSADFYGHSAFIDSSFSCT